MLEVTNDASVLPATGPLPVNLNAFVSPAQNLVNGYNIAEQTCFHKKTVGNLIGALKPLSAWVKSLTNLIQAAIQLITSSMQLVTDLTTLVSRTITLLGDLTALVAAVAALIPGLIGLIATIIGTLGAIGTAALVAAIAAIAAGVLCALFWVPFAGYGFLAAGAIAIAVLLAVVFFVIRGAVATIGATLGAVTGTLGTLAGPLATLTGSLGSVSAILASPPLPSDVTRSLAGVQNALTPVQNELTAEGPFVTGTATVLDQRVAELQSFLNPTPPAQPVVPRAHLEDTYRQAVRIYNDAIAAFTASTNTVWNLMQTNAENAPQVKPGGTLDKALACVGPNPAG